MSVINFTPVPNTEEQERSMRHLGLTLVAVVISLVLLGSFIDGGASTACIVVWIAISAFNVFLCGKTLVKTLRVCQN